MDATSLHNAVLTIGEWLACREGTPHYYLPVDSRDEADVVANEISHALEMPTGVTNLGTPTKPLWRVVVDRARFE